MDGGLAQVIIADPAWQYRGGGVQGDVDAQYTTMDFAQLAELPVRDWAAPDCVLAMWGTWPKLDEGTDLLRAWGFGYVTGFPWIKTVGTAIRRGIGFWTQSASEVILIGRRGEPKKCGGVAPVLGLLHSEERQFYAPGGAPGTHSRKPYGLHEWLEERFDGPYLELFARRKHPGWTTWGGDLGFLLTPGGVVKSEPKAQPQRDLFSNAA